MSLSHGEPRLHDANSPASRIVRPLIPPDAEERVERAFRQSNQILRDHIRAETGLKLSEGGERLSIPIKIREGFTWPFGNLIRRYDDPLLWALICGLRKLGAIIEGTNWLFGLWPELERWEKLPQSVADGRESIRDTRLIASDLQKLASAPDLIKEIKEMREDYLGCYFYPKDQSPWIEIYWMPIAVIAAMIDVPIEDLAIVVLIHELAHGYTHLGRDIDGASWDTSGFGKSDSDVKEGLAQFYTAVVSERVRLRHPRAHEAYLKFLDLQDGPYLAHLKWLEDQPQKRSETIRFTLLAERTKGVVNHDGWLASLKETNRKLARQGSLESR